MAPQRRRRAAGAVLAVLLLAACLRAAVTSVGPLLERIGEDTGLGATALGLLGSLPVIGFGVGSALVHRPAQRFGLERVIALALVALAGAVEGSGAAPVTVLTPTAPVRSCTAQVGPGFRDLLVREFYRAWEILETADRTGAAPWPELLAPPPLHRRHTAWAVLTVNPPGEGEFEEVLGAARGRLRALLAALEDAGAVDVHAWPRPFETGPALARYAIGLGRTPPDREVVAGIAERWRRGLPGVGVEVVEGGAVPTLR